MKLKTKDMIYAGAFAALYVVAVLIVMMLVGTIPLSSTSTEWKL